MNDIVILDLSKVDVIDRLADALAARIKNKDAREWVCEADMVKMITGNESATLSAPVVRRYRQEIQCKKEGKSWIYSTASIRAYLSR